MNKITITGKYTTRDGRPARVLCVAQCQILDQEAGE